MKQLYTVTTTFIAAFVCIFFCCYAHAANYTAVSSGKYSVGATWQGNNVPPITLSSGDKITIPNGVNVQLDRNLLLNVTATLEIDGTLSGGAGYVLNISKGTLSGSGTVSVDSFSCANTSGLTLSGTYSVNTWYTTSAMLSSGAKATVKKTLILAGGTMTLASGTLDLSSNSTIVVNSGKLVATGGTIDLTASYHVIYRGPNTNSGLELKGTGLRNVEVAMSGTNEVSLTDGLTLNGVLTLTSGALDLNGNGLRFTSGSDLSDAGSGTISGTTSSGIEVLTSGSPTGTLRFTQGKTDMGDITINLGDSSAIVKLGTEVYVNGKLELLSGRVDVGSSTLRLHGSATLNGGSHKSYVITNSGGKFSMGLNGGQTNTFYVGTSNNYAPCIIKSVAGSVNTTIGVSVRGDVKSNGENGTTVAATQPVVDATWVIESANNTGVEFDLEPIWSADMEVNSFNRAKAYVSHFTGGAWDAKAPDVSTTAPNNMYKVERTSIKSFGAFAVFDDKTAAGINTMHGTDDEISIYPNPVRNKLFVNINTSNSHYTVELYNVVGQLIKADNVQGGFNAINVADMKTGSYILHVKTDKSIYIRQFVKY